MNEEFVPFPSPIDIAQAIADKNEHTIPEAQGNPVRMKLLAPEWTHLGIEISNEGEVSVRNPSLESPYWVPVVEDGKLIGLRKVTA